MTKTIILLAGLPACGKDTVANYFKKKNFFSLTYSKHILKPIVQNTKKNLTIYIKETIGNFSEKEITNAINEIEKIKQTQTGRELLITLGGITLNKIIKKISNNEYTHFCLFGDTKIKNENKIIISGFRMKDELQTFKTLYPNANIKTILITTNDETRHQRIKQRDNIDEKTIIENEKYEKETTYNKLIQTINFNYIIENNETEKKLIEKLNQLNQLIFQNI